MSSESSDSFHLVSKRAYSPQCELINICLSQFCSPRRYTLLLSADPEERATARKTDTLWQCGDHILRLLCRQSEAIRDHTSDHQLVITRCDDMIEMAHEKLYVFPYKDVPACWMELYREASLLKHTALAMRGVWALKELARDFHVAPPFSESQTDDMVKTMDMSLIMTGPAPSIDTRESVEAVMDLLQECDMLSLRKDSGNDGKPAFKRPKLDSELRTLHCRFPSSPSNPYLRNPAITLKEPSLEVFEGNMHRPGPPSYETVPLHITHAIDHWPALGQRAWCYPDYLLSKTIGGRRLVPIETGKSYVDAGFGQRIVPFKEFLEQYILEPQSSAGAGYLAQHNLFAQIPSMREDIMIPDYCFTTTSGPHHASPLAATYSEVPRLEEPLLNAWFGPAGTTTPLHMDPYHNILAQVVGSKYIRLYAPKETPKLYARGSEDGIDMSNTSEVDVGIFAGLDGTQAEADAAAKKFPLFKTADYVECILEEGDCLYIPVGWWHYVRSLSISFSVSFWFN
jgi:hypothetical protein